MELTLEDISKRFTGFTAVDGVSARMHTGVYGLLGANGAGKTTLMRMICGILNPTSGRVSLDGQDIAALGERYRNLLGYLPQDFGYYPNFSAEEFLLYVAALKGLSNTAAKRKSRELLEQVALTESARKKIRTFSGGMKQRLGIAQALLNDPRILVLDEPTAGLDPKERVRFRNMIANLAKDKIILLSTHIVPDVESIADQILIMKKGRFLMSGTAQELTSSMVGCVWNYRLTPDEVERVGGDVVISNLKHDGPYVELRVISASQPAADATPAVPTLEDLYLYHFSDSAVPSLGQREAHL
ncbi:ABC transporter ATP-binding protein [Paenibacillus sp. CAA11]|uniref:ABC transporter ATP-binding protein n=1 Tax=Paenibacillus sp. CAA11 TaxID=1532905 RepID=UPI000D398549|nr:ABC transporter ATP-binding protein [Paenibacillus sp. CAA11]AWB46599.1 ABC transporter ATP-binding protein [Paenibacillus sp. CAA11]